jgi:phage terminase small subunit
MNYKQRAFIEEYLQDFNATQAAIRAGYSEKTARSQGQRLLTKVDISKEIETRVKEKAMSADEALLELGDIARLDVGDFLEFKDGIKEPYLNLAKAKEAGLLKLVKKLKYNVQGRVEIELYDKQAALVQIGKWQGLAERIEHTGKDGGEIIFKVVYDDDGGKLSDTPTEVSPKAS